MQPNFSLIQFQELLVQNGTYDAFIAKLREAAWMFPASCTGSVTYPLVYDLVYLRIVVRVTIEIQFLGSERTSRILCIKQISLDDYIEQCTNHNPEWHRLHEEIMKWINQ